MKESKPYKHQYITVKEYNIITNNPEYTSGC